ncbi:hypothetical protein D3C79_768890 [compost metagenome]
MRPVRVQRVAETQLFVGGAGDLQADLDNVLGFVGAYCKAQLSGIGNDEAVAAIGGVDLQRTVAFDLDPGVEAVGEGGHVLHFHPLYLAVAALGDGLDQAAGGFEHQARLGLGHRQDAAVEQHGGHAQRVGAGHRRGVGRLHDDPGHLRARVLGRHQQVDVAEHAAAWLIEDEVAQGLVAGDPARLLPDGGAGGRGDAADNDVTDFAFGVAIDDVDDLG